MDYRKSIQNSLDYIEDNLKTPITAMELSEQAGYSLFHYYRLFQSAVGLPVMQYILRRRLIHAIYEIRCGHKRIDVILEYGFETYAGFYKAFRREFECTPSTFIRKGWAKRPYRLNLYKEDYMVSHKKDILSLSGQFCREYLSDFGNLYNKLPKQIIHRDPNPSNIIVAQDEWGFIDFELSEKNLRIYDPCYAAAAILSESFDEKNQAKLSQWLEIYRNILWGYDSIARLTDDECNALPYVVMANQLVSTAWFSEQDKYTEIFETNKRMTLWITKIFGELRLN